MNAAAQGGALIFGEDIEISQRTMKSRIAQVFSEGYGRFKSYLRASFAGLSEFDAEDIVQQAAVSLLERDGGEIENLSAYIYASLRNGAKNLFRKRGREVSGEEPQRGGCSSAEEEAVKNEFWDVFEKALDSLDERSRFVYMKTEFEGKSYRELSEETGEPVGTLLSRKNRAAKKLMAVLAEYLD